MSYIYGMVSNRLNCYIRLRSLGYYIVKEVAELAAVTTATLHLHREKGKIPPPSYHCGGFACYTEAEKCLILDYFAKNLVRRKRRA